MSVVSAATDVPILILFAHPYPHRSRVNLPLLTAVRDLPGVVVNDLYERYPDFYIRPRPEQALLEAANIVVMQHPLYWYSAPALLKQWQESVLEYGFAIGRSGTALQGKWLLQVITTGHREEAYAMGGRDRYSITELLRPFEQTARHCGMRYLEPLLIHGVRHLDEAAITAQANRYRERLLMLRADWQKMSDPSLGERG